MANFYGWPGRQEPDTARIEAALNRVLRQAVLRKDDAVIEAYREIYHKTRSSRTGHREQTLAALRLGLLLGAEVKRHADPA